MENPKQKSTAVAFLMAASGIVMFSSKAIFVKMAYMHEVDTITLLLLRMLFALPVFIIIALFSTLRPGMRSALNSRQILMLIGLGFAGYYLASYFDFEGLNYISASMERLILFVYPTMVVLLTALIYRQGIPRLQVYAILITYFGVLIIFFRAPTPGSQSNLVKGVVLILSSAFTYALYLVGSGSLIPKVGSVRFTSYAMIVSCLGVIAHFLIKNDTGLRGHDREVYQIGAAMALIWVISYFKAF